MKLIRRILRSLPWVVLSMFLLAVALFALVRVDRTVVATGEVRIQSYQVIRPRISGTIAEVEVQPGDRVESNQVLARLRASELEQDLIATRQQLADARVHLGGLRGERSLLIERIHPLQRQRNQEDLERSGLEAAVGQTRVVELEIQLKTMAERLRRTERLAQEGLLSDQTLQEARFAKLEAEQRFERTKLEEQLGRDRRRGLYGELDLLRGEQRLAVSRFDAQIEALSHQVERWSARLAQIQELLESYKIRSAMAGVVVSVSTHELLGRQVDAGERLFTVIDTESILFLTEVPEQAIVRVRRGQKAQIELVGLPRQRFDMFPGRVQKVAQEPEVPEGGGPIAYPVEIQLEAPWVDLDDGRFFLRSGMRGNAKIAYRSGVPAFEVLYEFLVGEARGQDGREARRERQEKSPTLARSRM